MNKPEDRHKQPAVVSRELRQPMQGRVVLDAAQLFGGARELSLMYGNEEYRLRITRNGKLILTK